MRLRVYHFSGVLAVLMGFLMIAIPYWVFPVCEETLTLADGSSFPMPCHWLAKAEIAMGICCMLCGVAFLKVTNKRMELGVAIVSLGIFAVAVIAPGLIFGGCDDELMTCYRATRPALIQVSLVGFFGMLFGTIRLYNEIKRFEAGETAFVPLFQTTPPPRRPKPADEEKDDSTKANAGEKTKEDFEREYGKLEPDDDETDKK